MPTPEIPTEVLEATVAAYNAAHGDQSAAAEALGLARSTLQNRLKRAAERGLMLGHTPAMPGFVVSKVTTAPDGGQHVTQKKEHGETFAMPQTHVLGKMTVQRDAEGRVVQDWIRTLPDAAARDAAMKAALEGFKDSLPKVDVVPLQARWFRPDLLNQFTLTDAHFGMLADADENGDADWNLKIAEATTLDWFAAAIDMSPPAATAILAQLGDMLHYDGFESKTPTHGHILDSDSRYPKVVRAVIRTLRAIMKMLLEKHEKVHVIMADANHDPGGETWLREMFAAFYEDEPRVTVDNSMGSYYVYQHGDVSLFYHHGHKRKIGNVDTVFAGQFREIYGNTRKSYAHIGHIHSDELKSTNLMKVERHETLAAADGYSSNGGWLSGRSAKVITYNRSSEVFRSTLTPEMVAGWRDQASAANDNEVRRAA